MIEISWLIHTFQRLQMELTAEEIADILWLAAQRHSRTPASEDEKMLPIEPPQKVEEKKQTPIGRAPSKETDKQPIASEAAPLTQREAKSSYLVPKQNNSTLNQNEYLPFCTPGGKGLPGTLLLSRSLRPLRRLNPKKTSLSVDEEATAHRIAEEHIFLPVFKQIYTRWHELALVVDASPSMAIWRQVTQELQSLLERTGIFQNIRLYSFGDSRGQITLFTKNGQIPHHPSELTDPTGRQVILIASDCVSSIWNNKDMVKALEKWGQHQTIAVIQMLPERFWSQTALHPAQFLKVSALSPNTPNIRLKKHSLSKRNTSLSGCPIPIFALEPSHILKWACLVSNLGKTMALAVIVKGKEKIEEAKISAEPGANISADDRLYRFNNNASSKAFELACLFAAAPITLPIMRLVQNTMLPDSKQVHLAEVFLGGLLQRDPDSEQSSDPDQIQYDFFPGVRELLLDASPVPQSIRVLEKVSKYIEKHLGQPLDFQSLLVDPQVVDSMQVGHETRPFALVAAEVLSRLGGRYAEAAKKLQEKANPKPNANDEPRADSEVLPVEEKTSEPVLDLADSEVLSVEEKTSEPVLDLADSEALLETSLNKEKIKPVVLIHIHPDFTTELTELLKEWNSVQNGIQFVDLLLAPKWENMLAGKGKISDKEASTIAAEIREKYGYTKVDVIIIVTEKTLYNDNYSQLFSSGILKEQIGIISLAVTRKLYKNDKPLIFSVLAVNILHRLGKGAGLKRHEGTRGCVMDFCNNMEDIKVGVQKGILFCDECSRKLNQTQYPFLSELARLIPDSEEENISHYWNISEGKFKFESPNSFIATTSVNSPSNVMFCKIPISDWDDVEIECFVTASGGEDSNLPPECDFILQGDGWNRDSGYFIWLSSESIKVAKGAEEFKQKCSKSKETLNPDEETKIVIRKQKRNIQVHIGERLHDYVDEDPSELPSCRCVGINIWGRRNGTCVLKDFKIKEKGRLIYPLPRLVLIHIYPDFATDLNQLLREWNSIHGGIKFIELQLEHKWESAFVAKGKISVNKASNIAAKIRKEYGYTKANGIIIFTEKRLYDDIDSQLFIGGIVEEQIGIISLAFLRDLYKNDKSLIFLSIVANILHSLGRDAGIEAHKDTRGCVMDFCDNMEDINVGLQQRIHFCDECSLKLNQTQYPFLATLAKMASESFDYAKLRKESLEQIEGEEIAIDRPDAESILADTESMIDWDYELRILDYWEATSKIESQIKCEEIIVNPGLPQTGMLNNNRVGVHINSHHLDFRIDRVEVTPPQLIKINFRDDTDTGWATDLMPASILNSLSLPFYIRYWENALAMPTYEIESQSQTAQKVTVRLWGRYEDIPAGYERPLLLVAEIGKDGSWRRKIAKYGNTEEVTHAICQAQNDFEFEIKCPARSTNFKAKSANKMVDFPLRLGNLAGDRIEILIIPPMDASCILTLSAPPVSDANGQKTPDPLSSLPFPENPIPVLNPWKMESVPSKVEYHGLPYNIWGLALDVFHNWLDVTFCHEVLCVVSLNGQRMQMKFKPKFLAAGQQDRQRLPVMKFQCSDCAFDGNIDSCIQQFLRDLSLNYRARQDYSAEFDFPIFFNNSSDQQYKQRIQAKSSVKQGAKIEFKFQTDPPIFISSSEPEETLDIARQLLTGPEKELIRAREILMNILHHNIGNLILFDRCRVYVYLGYIEDIQKNRKAAIQWYKMALSLGEHRAKWICRIAEKGLTKPVTWIDENEKKTVRPLKHLDRPVTLKSDAPTSISPESNKLSLLHRRSRNFSVLIQDILFPIDERIALEALEPDSAASTPVLISPDTNEFPWDNAAEYQKKLVEETISKIKRLKLPTCFAVFSLAPVPLAIHLGFILSDRVEVRCFQYHRDIASWKWPERESTKADCNFQVHGLPGNKISKKNEVVMRVNLSASIAPKDTQEVAHSEIEVDIAVAKPDVLWLCNPSQLAALARTFRDVLTALRGLIPGCSKIHLFYAGPTPGAIVIGQQINPRMNPPVEVYQYSHQAKPCYQRALTLKE